MSLNVLFITETLVKSRTAISEAIDGKQILPVIKLAQDKFILPALGSFGLNAGYSLAFSLKSLAVQSFLT